MLFTSYEFILFMIVLITIYYLIPKKCQWALLLLGSCMFYLFADERYLVYILMSTLSVYAAAVFMDKSRQKKKRKILAVLTGIFNISILILCKFPFTNLIVPMGISFYTLQSIGYLTDVYRKTVRAERNLFKMMLFISFFPQLVQGPISRYEELSKTLYKKHVFNKREFYLGLQRVLWGYFKKLVIADRINLGLSVILEDSDSYMGAYVLVIMLFYTIQLYADFTGGTDITIGISKCLGIEIAENFNLPFFSKSLKEYWRRWHITLGTWFRDYVFYPVSTSGITKKFSKFAKDRFGNSKGRKSAVYISSFIVWVLTGIWHGTGSNFIVWGLLNYTILMTSEEMKERYKSFHKRYKWSNQKLYKIWMILRTFLLVSILKLFDCYDTAAETVKAFVSIFTKGNMEIFTDGSLLKIGLKAEDYVVILMGIVIMFIFSFAGRKENTFERLEKQSYKTKFVIWFGLFIIVTVFGIYGSGYDANQFIYNRF